MSALHDKPHTNLVETYSDSADTPTHPDQFKGVTQPIDAEALGINEKALLRKTSVHPQHCHGALKLTF